MKFASILLKIPAICIVIASIRLGTKIRRQKRSPLEDERFDFFLFGSANEISRSLISNHSNYFQTHVRSLHLIQKTEDIPKEFRRFEDVTVDVVDFSDAASFDTQLKKIVRIYATDEVPMHVFPTYFSDEPTPHLEYHRDSLQINLNSRLQILEAFLPHLENTRFHLLGALSTYFPYKREYPLSMWYVNNVLADPDNPHYNGMDIVIHNLAQRKKQFWWDNEPQIQEAASIYMDIPTEDILKRGFSHRVKGSFSRNGTLLETLLSIFE